MVEKSVGIITMERMDNRILNSVGSSRIRMRWLLHYWPEAEEYIIGKKYEIMIFQKVYWGAMMEAFKGIKILDLCDPDWLENKPVFEFADMVDAITTSTEPLAEYVKKMRPNALVKYIPDRVYLPEAVPIKKDHSERIKTVVWFGYSQNSHYLARVYDELIARDITLVTITDQEITPTLSYRGKVRIHNIAYSYQTYIKDIVQYDAIIMPDPFGDERSKYKSNNKLLQAWSLGMPVIRVPKDFDRLLTKEVRVVESETKKKEVLEKWDVRLSVKEYQDLIEEIKRRKNG